MATKGKSGDAGTREHPWQLKTPSGTSEFQAFRDETLDPPALVVKSGSTELRYHLRCISDLSRSRRRTARSKPGDDPRKTRSAGGTA